MSRARRAPLEAAILDLDGVVTRTASVHERAWKDTFDPLLAATSGQAPFSHLDYLQHVDGRPRLDGVKAFLASRGLALPLGAPADAPGIESQHALARRKQDHFDARLDALGVEVFDDAVAQLHRWRDEGLSTALVSSSRNAAHVLAVAGLDVLFDACVDGETGRELGLPGKPAPDYFLEAARRLGVAPERAMVVEDAVSGVMAGRRGEFGLVVGVSREGADEALRRAGADLVVPRLTEIAPRPVRAERRSGGDREATARR
jgi:beta-phosphoglucomutase family hydrolase